MFALLRVLTESLVCGLWLLHCATDAELSQFKKEGIDKNFGALINEVEVSIGVITPILSNLKTTAWKAMNGFTHTGFIQVSRRHGEEVVGSNYPDDELKRAQSLAGALLVFHTKENRIIHVVCAPKTDYLAIITAYLPVPDQWSSDFKVRR